MDTPAVGEEILLINLLDSTSTCTSENIRRWTDRDPVLSKVRLSILQGWTSTPISDLAPYYSKRDELTTLKGCVLWGIRVIIPPQGRVLVTDMLHETHPGIVKMKNLARGYMWWPKMDMDLERCVKTCRQCQSVRVLPLNNQPLHPWEFPSKPWSRIHIDYAGPMNGKMYLVLVDAYSKWLEVVPTSGCSAQTTVNHLRRIFATHGLPDIIVSDNGTSFTGSDFQEFVNNNNIRHVTSAPYHPATNGLAENAVKTFKMAMKKSPGGNSEDILYRFLFDYRISPHSTTGIPPCELLMNRKVKSRFDMLRPSISDKVMKKQEVQAKNFQPRSGNSPTFNEGDSVYFRNYSRSGPPNVPGTVLQRTGPVSCRVQSESGTVVRKHFTQLFRQEKPVPSEAYQDIENNGENYYGVCNEAQTNTSIGPMVDTNTPARVPINEPVVSNPIVVEPRRSGRVTKPVVKLDL